jgi:hypothetical protein
MHSIPHFVTIFRAEVPPRAPGALAAGASEAGVA